jgi:hypothetical protein
VLARVGGARARVSLLGRNLLTWDRYSGYDPEVGSINRRIDDFTYPRFRTGHGQRAGGLLTRERPMLPTLRAPLRRARRAAAAAAAAAAGLAAAGCQELDVRNPNDPDRLRVQQQASSVEGLASTAFRSFWPWVHDDSPVWAMATMADDFTAAFFDFGILVASSEPRVAFDNSQNYADRFVNQDPWYGLYATLSTSNDVLAALDRGVRLPTDAETARTRAVARFVQGLSTGYLALYFDRAWVVTETTRADTLTVPGTTRLKGDPLPYAQVMDSAQAMLADAARLADAGPAFTLPEGAWLHQNMDNRRSPGSPARTARASWRRSRARAPSATG